MVIVALVITIGLCFAMVFWYARLHPSVAPPLLWRQGPAMGGSSLL
jgi:hypothetical protein